MINRERLLDTFLQILSINSYYPNEDPVVDLLRPRLSRSGVQLTVDESRNVLGFWPGSGGLDSIDPILLCAHTDTVRPTRGMVPEVRDGRVYSNGETVLGADDKAAVAAIVEAIESITDAGLAHPPAEILLTVGEDVGHIGSKAFQVGPVRSKMAFIPDADGPVGGVMLAAPWMQANRVIFHGRDAHAGMEPEKGRSAISMLARAIDSMPLGRIDEETTANVGTVQGGEATNVVPPQAELVWQVRSLDQEKFDRIRDQLLSCCQEGARAFDGTMTWETLRDFVGFRFQPGDPIVRRAESAIRAADLKPWRSVTCGGSDANELNAKGLASIVISVGYLDIHTHEESMPIDELQRLTNVCRALLLNQ